MGKDIKDLIGSIINDTDNSYPNTSGTEGGSRTLTFDRGAFREKLSLSVLRDIISTMTDDQLKDVDGMIDTAIMNHINKNYNGSCYNYLCKCRDKCDVTGVCASSPMLGSIVQEIDEKTDEAEKKVNITKDPSTIDDTMDPLELEKNVDNYAQFREAIRKKVSDKIVNSVAAEIVGSNSAPTFVKTLDDELQAKKPGSVENGEASSNQVELSEPEPEGDIPASIEEKPVGESVIISAMQEIIAESYAVKNPIDMDTALNKAIVEFCIAEMDFCFKQFDQAHQFYANYIK